MSKGEDSRSLRAAWVGNIYQKFEAMCQEVDDIVSQEHIKNLENHVQSVGDNVMKFCSNVKDLIPSSFGVPVKHEAQSVNCIKSNLDVIDCDADCCSVAKDEEFSQQMDVTGSAKRRPSCIQVSDDLHFEDKRENPPSKEPSSLLSGLQLVQRESFSINQDCDFHSEEMKGTSEVICPESPDNYFSDESYDSFSEEKQSSFKSSEMIYHGNSLVTEESDSFTTTEEELLSNISEFIFPDEDPCEMSPSSVPHHQDHKLVGKGSIDVSASVHEHSVGSEFHLKDKETVQEIVDAYSLGPEFPCNDELVNDYDSIHENSRGFEFYLKEDILCDSVSPGSQVFHKEEMACSIVHKSTPGSKFRMTEDILHDSVPRSCFDVSTDNVPYSLLLSSVTSSDNETSKVRLTSSIISPLLDSSEHGETEFQYREGYTLDNMVAEISSASAFPVASQSSESSPCFESPKGDIGDMDSSSVSSRKLLLLTDVPKISHSVHGGHKLEHMELDKSCIFVKPDSNHTVLSAVERYWLHKKIRTPFSSRKKLEKEYKHLSIWYCDIDAEFNDISQEKPVSTGHKKHLQSQDSQESEWELV